MPANDKPIRPRVDIHLRNNGIFDPIDQVIRPNWDVGGEVHNWRRYVGDSVKEIWDTFTVDQRVAIAIAAQEHANKEDWD